MWTRIARIILKNRFYLLIGVGLVTIFMSYQLTKVELDYHYANMLSEKHPTYIDNAKFKEIFGDEANVIICGFTDTSFFELNQFVKLQKLCNDLEKSENVVSVISIPRILNIRQATIKDSEGRNKREFETYRLFPDKIASQQELDSLKQEFYSLPFYNGFLYNDSTNVYLLTVGISKDVLNSKERIPTVREVERLILDYAEESDIEVHISGMPYIRTNMMSLIKDEIKMFVILAALICIIILYLFFRSFKVIGVSVIVIGIGVVWAVGLMGVFDFKITILSGMIPPLLIVIGIPNIIYLMNKYHRETKIHGNKILALQRVIRKIGNAIFLTNLTTAAGFATFIITNSRYLVEFGIVASLGIMCLFTIALIVIPSIFSYLEVPSGKYIKHLDNKYVNSFVAVLLSLVINHRPKIYISVAVILVLSLYGITKIHRTGYFLDDVKKDDPVYLDLKFFERNFNGASPLEISVESKDSLTNIEKIARIEKLDSLQTALKKYPELSRSMSIADAIKFLYQGYSRGNPDNFALPPNPRTYETIFDRLPTDMNSNTLLNSFIDSTNSITRISLNIEDIGTKRMEELLPKIQMDIDHYFPPNEYNTIITGSTIIYFVGSQYLINNLFISLSLAFILISIILFLMFRSGKMIAISLIPNIIPMLITAALMGYFNIPLKPSTILVFSIAFGISVDNTIHYLAKYRQELRSNFWQIKISAHYALKETSVSMMYTSCVLFFGFGIFVASDFGGTVALGLLVSIALLVAMFSNLLILPSLLLSLDRHFSRKNFTEPHINILEEDDASDDEEELVI
jgi:uncharacterized protein